MEYSDEKLDLLVDIMNQTNWEKVSEVDEILTERIFLKGSDIACFRSSSFIKADPTDAANFLLEIYERESEMKKYYKDVSNYEVVTQIDDMTRICYQINQLPWPLYPRDFVYLQSVKQDDGEIWIYMYSVECDQKPRQDKYVRGTVNISAYGFITENDGCRVYRLIHVDPAGQIPTAVINNYANETGTMIKALQQEFF